MTTKDYIETALFLILLIIIVGGWWTTLFIRIIPTLSIPLNQILELSLLNIVYIIFFFIPWLAAMIIGVITIVKTLHEVL